MSWIFMYTFWKFICTPSAYLSSVILILTLMDCEINIWWEKDSKKKIISPLW